MMMGKYDLVQAEAENAVEFYNKRHFARYMKVYRAVAKGYLSVALVFNGDKSELEKAELLSREALDEPLIKGYYRALIHCNAITAFLGMAKLEEAQAMIQSLEKTLPAVKNNRRIQYILLRNKASLLYLQGNHEGALEILDHLLPSLIRGKDEYVNALTLRIRCLSRIKRLEEAEIYEREIREALENSSPVLHPSCLLTLSQLALDKKDMDQARHYAEQAADNSHTPYLLAESMLIQAEVFAYYKNPNRALALSQQAVELFPVPVYKAWADRIAKTLKSDVLEQNEDANLLRISNQAG